MSNAVGDALLTAGALCGAIAAIATVAWWLVGPRVKASLRELVEASKEARDELQVSRPGSTARNASIAAEHVRELPRLRSQLDIMRNELHAIVEAKVVERLTFMEVETENHSRRIGNVEQLIIEHIGAPRRQRGSHHDNDDT